MEQQKLLWTILSVGILILILLGAGIFFFLPSDGIGLIQNSKPTEWSKSAIPLPPAEQKTPSKKATPAPDSPVKIEIKKTPIQPTPTPAPTPKDTPAAKPASPAPASNQAANTTPTTKAAPATPPSMPATSAQPAPKPEQATQAAKPAQPAKPTQAAKPAPATKPTTTADKPGFWIQVGSYATQDAAEETKKNLTAKGYPASIQAIETNGKTYHRVKVGPYTNRADINTLLPKIKALPGMSDSFITTN